MTEEQMAYSYWLDCLEGIGRKTIFLLMKEAGTPAAVYGLPEGRLARLLKPGKLKLLLDSRARWDVWGEYERLRRRGIGFFPFYHPGYPRRLAQIPDAPHAVYVLGRLPEEDKPSVAVVGARQCSPYGREVAAQFGGVLAGRGVQIVSGMARGVDGISQRAALRAGGSTFAVLGCGVDVCYPEENRQLYEELSRGGGVISEYPPGTLPKAGLFPLRNRLISGLSDVVLVVEAREKSGTLITVDMALEQGREVYTVPGRITDRLSAGCNRLILQGAGMALSPEDVLEALGGRGGDDISAGDEPGLAHGQEALRSDRLEKPPSRKAAGREKVFLALENSPKAVEAIYQRLISETDMPVQELFCHLVELCVEGRAGRTENGCFFRK